MGESSTQKVYKKKIIFLERGKIPYVGVVVTLVHKPVHLFRCTFIELYYCTYSIEQL